MTYPGASLVMGAWMLWVTGCGSSLGKSDGGSTDAPADDGAPAGSTGAGGSTGAAGTTGQGGATAGTTGTGGSAGTGVDAGGDARDCFPECVAALRRTCERPPYGAGSCASGTSGSDTVYCYSNGVREIRSAVVDAGTTAEFTQPDGQTVCYQVVVSFSTQSFRTPAGQEVAQAVAMGGSTYAVTCAGSTTSVIVDINDPSCRTLNSGDCTPGGCP
jgi:hypothetical protein